MKGLLYLTLITVLSASIFFGCKEDEPENDDNNSFDRKAMLRNLGNNVIIPDYKNFKQKANTLSQSAKKFASNANKQTLKPLREDFKEAYLAWQKVTPYGFGPAKSLALRTNVNTFPADTQEIPKRVKNNNQEWGPYDNDTKGFPALDYLLYRDSEEAVIDSFKESPHAGNRKSYLKAITKDIAQMAGNVYRKWISSGGDYLKTFSNANGNDKGSSLALLVNQMNFDYEIIKNDKLGIPLGKKSLGDPLPNKVEAYYSGISLKLMITNLNAIENLFLGRYDGKNGKGLDDHLDAVDAKRNGKNLSNAIVDQFAKARTELKQLDDPLSKAIKNNKTQADKAYEEVQKQVVLIKTDMPSALGVRITYQDNDGD